MKFARLLAPWPLFSIIVVVCGLSYFIFSLFYVYTSDAYLSANIINVNPQVSGPVQAIYVVDNQIIHTNQLLFQIDPTPFRYAVERAKGEISAALINRAHLLEQINATQARIESSTANMQWYKSEAKRIEPLAKAGVVSQEKGSQVYFALQQAQDNLLQAKRDLLAIKAQLGGPTEDDFAPLIVARANLKTAEENLSYTTLRSPAEGTVVNFLLRVGQYVSQGQDLFAIIDYSHVWVVAQFKETALRHIKVGQKVAVYFDMYPFHKFTAYVESIGWGVNRQEASNSVVNSSLPYVEQTEYWVRLSQRFPVRIRIDNSNPDYPLRVGASARVFIER